MTDESCVAAGSAAGAARRIWTVGFGPSHGVAEALALLLHEKARLPAVAASPSGFRHGLVEASSAADSLVVIECRDEDPPLTAYFDRLAIEGQRVGLKIAWLAQRDRAGLNIRLRGSSQAERALEAVVPAQQMAPMLRRTPPARTGTDFRCCTQSWTLASHPRDKTVPLTCAAGLTASPR